MCIQTYFHTDAAILETMIPISRLDDITNLTETRDQSTLVRHFIFFLSFFQSR